MEVVVAAWSRRALKTAALAIHLLAVAGGALAMLAAGPVAHASPLRPKAGARPSAQQAEQTAPALVERLIITPHPTRGGKLHAQLEQRRADRLAALSDMPLSVERKLSERSHLLKLERAMSIPDARALAARLKASGEVEAAEPDLLMQPQAFAPNDPAYGGAPGQWNYFAPSGLNLGGADMPSAWDQTLGSTSITVAVIDTGYRPHPDLQAMLPGYDFISSTATANDGGGRDSDASDPGDYAPAGACGSGSAASASSWHGTHVIGTVAALMNNGLYGTGVAPNVRILPLRALGRCGGYTSDIVDAMRWAAGIDIAGVPRNLNPARVINLSLGSTGSCSAAFQAAIQDVNTRGAVVVVATGNGGYDAVNQPANCSGVVAVTAHAIDGDSADYANIGPEVAISAPGGGCGTLAYSCYAGLTADGPPIYSLGNSGLSTPQADTYAYKRGTSMAAPHVAGTIALMLSLNPALSRTDILAMLRNSARAWPQGSACTLPANSGLCGAGLLDAGMAIAALAAVAPLVQTSPANQVVAPGAIVHLSGSAQPAAGRSIASYGWRAATSNPRPVVVGQPQSAQASFIAPPTGRYAFTLTATDSAGATGTATATVRVNSLPVPQPLPASAVSVGERLSLQLSALDVDGDAISYHAGTLPEGATLSGSGLLTWPAASPVGSYTIEWQASDDIGSSAPQSLRINVTDAGSATAAAPAAGGGGSMEGDAALLIGAVVLLALRRGGR